MFSLTVRWWLLFLSVTVTQQAPERGGRVLIISIQHIRCNCYGECKHYSGSEQHYSSPQTAHRINIGTSRMCSWFFFCGCCCCRWVSRSWGSDGTYMMLRVRRGLYSFVSSTHKMCVLLFGDSITLLKHICYYISISTRWKIHGYLLCRKNFERCLCAPVLSENRTPSYILRMIYTQA